MSGEVGDVVDFERTTEGGNHLVEVRIDVGGSDPVTGAQYGPAGEDAPPLSIDEAVAVKVSGTGKAVIIGIADLKNAGVAEGGEKRIYARDSGGSIVASVYLKADGHVHLADDVAAALIARADRVEAELEKIKTAHNDHIHITSATVGSGPTVGTIQKPAITYTPGEVGCDRVHGT